MGESLWVQDIKVVQFDLGAERRFATAQRARCQESAFFAALEDTGHFEFNEGNLVLSDAGNNTLAVLAPQ